MKPREPWREVPRPRRMMKCYVCGRTGTQGFITRKGRRVCWSVPMCTERVMNPPLLSPFDQIRMSPAAEEFRRAIYGLAR